MSDQRKFDPTWIWVVIALLVLHSCAVDDAFEKLKHQVDEVNAKVDK